MSGFMANGTPAPIDRRCGRILVVDDERSMRELLQIVLRREGHQVRLAEDGRTAVAEMEREPVDVLISDIKMPGMTGVDVLREAKRIDPDIVGIMVTAYASTDTAVEALRLGARREPGNAAGMLVVQDEGVGIPESEIDGIFQPFRGTFAHGSGLGMAIVHRIVNDYGGEIHVTSKPGAGTTVEVRFPARAAVAA